MAIRDLFVKLGFGTEGVEKIDKADRALKSAKESAINLGDAVRTLGILWVARSVVNGVRDFISGSLQQADALKHQADALGLTTAELQKYQYAAGLVGVTTQQAAVGLRFWDRVVGEAEFGTKSAVTTFQRLGISLKDASGHVKPTNELLFEFSDRLKALPDQNQRVALAMRTLGRNGAALLPFLQQGSAALKEMFADVEMLGGGFDEAFIQQAHELDVQQKRLAMGWRSMGVEIMRVLMPALRAWVDNGIRNVRMLIDMARHTSFAKTALIALAAIAVASGIAVSWAWLPEIAIFAAIAAAVLAAYLVFDDFYTFLQGGQSIIGDSLDSAGVDSKNLAAQLKADFEAIGKAIQVALGLTGDFKSSLISAFIDSIPSIVSWGGQFITFVVKTIDMAVSGIKELGMLLKGILQYAFSSKTFGAANADFSNMLDNVGKDNDAAAKRWDTYDKMANDFAALGSKTPSGVAPAVPGVGGTPTADEQNPGRTTGGAPTQHNNTTNHVNVTVNAAGAPNPAAVGSAVANGVRQGLRNPDTTNRNTFDAVSDVAPVGVGA